MILRPLKRASISWLSGTESKYQNKDKDHKLYYHLSLHRIRLRCLTILLSFTSFQTPSPNLLFPFQTHWLQYWLGMRGTVFPLVRSGETEAPFCCCLHISVTGLLCYTFGWKSNGHDGFRHSQPVSSARSGHSVYGVSSALPVLNCAGVQGALMWGSSLAGTRLHTLKWVSKELPIHMEPDHWFLIRWMKRNCWNQAKKTFTLWCKPSLSWWINLCVLFVQIFKTY